jgi:GT2 family glycosyltransferase
VGRPCHVAISILNWNSARITLDAVRSVLTMPSIKGVTTELVLVDNGSRPEDVVELRQGVEGLPIRLICLPNNTGFAGGHNSVMRDVLQRGADFVWLLNSDAEVSGNCLEQLLDLMDEQPRCGVASPVIVRLGQPHIIDFAGAAHDWRLMDSQLPLELPAARALAVSHARDFWVVGTAMLLRATALKTVGLLDERYFAYFEDDDICARMTAAGWHSAVAYDAHVEHACFEGSAYERPPYYFYLMARNAFRFWTTHAPADKPRWLHLRLLEKWLYYSNRLNLRGDAAKRDACLLGIWDGLLKRSGAPQLDRRAVPWLLGVLRRLRQRNHEAHMAVRPE